MPIPSNLTEQQLELLNNYLNHVLESINVICKITSKGCDSEVNGITCKEKLEKCLGGVRATIIELCNQGVLSKDAIHLSADAILYLNQTRGS